MIEAKRTRYRAAITAIAPVMLAAGFLYHPFIPNPDPAAVAAAASQDTFRWGLSHLMVGVGSGFIALAFLAVRSWLRDAGAPTAMAIQLPSSATTPSLSTITLSARRSVARRCAIMITVRPSFNRSSASITRSSDS